MKKETYRRLVESVGKSRGAVLLLRWTDKLIVVSTIIGYLLYLACMFALRDFDALYQGLLVPAAGFAGVSIFRRVFPSKRPYEETEIEPLIPKETKGRSFPSRHVFSVFMIGMTYLRFSPGTAACLFLMGAVLSAVRVSAGIHYIKDVAAGALMAVLIGGLGYFVIF